MRRLLLAGLVGLSVTGLLSSSGRAQSSSTLRLTHCLVSLIDDIEVPAERAGVLKELSVREGDYLNEGAVIALIDDLQATHQAAVAKAELAAANVKAENELDQEYAVATHRTAEAEFQIAQTANRSLPNTVAAVEVEKLRLAADQARIKIGVSHMERRIATAEMQGFAAKAALSEADLTRHRVVAPLAGEAVEIFFRRGEWIEPGKPLVRLVRLDRLRIEGFVRFREHPPGTILNRPVRAEIASAGGTEVFAGKVAFVSAIVQPGGEYRIWAEVDNRRSGEHWILRPGLEAEMTIEINALGR